MKRIINNELLNYYITENNIESIFDKDMLKHAQLHFYEKNEFILKAGFELEYYYLFVDGKIKVSYLLENGKSILLKFYKDFNPLGDVELINNTPIRCNIETIEDSYLVAIPADILRKSYMDNPKFLHYIINCLSDKFYAVCNNSSYNLVYPLINRLSSYLVEHITDKDYIVLNSSYIEIAQFLGTTYRHLNRTLKELESEKVIKCENKKIYIIDVKKLRELSKNLYIKSVEY